MGASTPSVTSWPTLASTWTAPTSCFASTNYYFVLLGGGFFSNMYGTPTPVLTGNTPSGACFPPSFTINVPYETHGGCPSGYTQACATGISESFGHASMVTCCPSVTGGVFSFMCRDNEYGCHATATPGVTWTGVVTDIPAATEAPTTRAPSTGEGIEAWGIKLLSVSTTSTSTSTSKSTSTSASTASHTSDSPNNEGIKSSGKSSLSTGAIVGIVIGCVGGIIILALLAFVFYRRRARKRALPFEKEAQQHGPNDPQKYNDQNTNGSQGPYMLDGQNYNDSMPPGPFMLDTPGTVPRVELAG